MLLDIVQKPFRSRCLCRMGIIYALQVLSVLIVPAFILAGYFTLLSKSVVRDSPEPQFSNPVGLAVLGVKVVAVVIAYFLLPFAFFVSAIVFVYYTGIDTLAQAQQVSVSTLGIYPIIALSSGTILTGIVLYILPGALVELAVSNDMTRAFSSEQLHSHLFTWEYIASLVGLLVLSIIWVIGVYIAVYTRVGLLVIPLVTTYFSEVLAYLFGTAYKRSETKMQQDPFDTKPPDDLQRYE